MIYGLTKNERLDSEMENACNAQALRLYENLLNFTEIATAQNIVCAVAISKSPSEKKKLEWVNSICEGLADNFDNEIIEQIRMGCSCNVGNSRKKQVKAIYDKSKNLDDFVQKYNDGTTSSAIWTEGGTIFFSYPTCYCSMVKHNTQNISPIWCYCTVGFTKQLFEYVFDCEVHVKLLESIKTGGNKCVMSINMSINMKK